MDQHQHHDKVAVLVLLVVVRQCQDVSYVGATDFWFVHTRLKPSCHAELLVELDDC